MMERRFMEKLTNWKDKPDRKPLVITGARQCGKTYLVRSFGEEQFSDVVYLNFEKDSSCESIFAYDFDVERIVREIGTLYSDKAVSPGETLLILDEVQKCPRAISALKYFYEEMPQLHVLCIGTLLGSSLHDADVSFPVGKCNLMQVYPMSFEEFVAADGGTKYLKLLQDTDTIRFMPESLRATMEKYFYNYCIIGGMPQVVDCWVQYHDYQKCEELQDEILLGYEGEFRKISSKSMSEKVTMIWNSVPEQLSKDNNKFMFSHVQQGKRQNDLKDALLWLVDAGLVHRVSMITDTWLPLSVSADESNFKLYMLDVGLLRRKSKLYYKMVLENNSTCYSFINALKVNYTLTELMAQDMYPYFWRSGNLAEVDFVLERQGQIIPIEIREADNGHAKNFGQFCGKYVPDIGFKCSLKGLSVGVSGETTTVNLPLYMFYDFEKYVDKYITKESMVRAQ